MCRIETNIVDDSVKQSFLNLLKTLSVSNFQLFFVFFRCSPSSKMKEVSKHSYWKWVICVFLLLILKVGERSDTVNSYLSSILYKGHMFSFTLERMPCYPFRFALVPYWQLQICCSAPVFQWKIQWIFLTLPIKRNSLATLDP